MKLFFPPPVPPECLTCTERTVFADFFFGFNNFEGGGGVFLRAAQDGRLERGSEVQGQQSMKHLG